MHCLKIIGVGRHGNVQKFKNHENDGFSGLPKIKPIRSFRATLFFKFAVNIALPRPPPDPNSGLSPGGFSCDGWIRIAASRDAVRPGPGEGGMVGVQGYS